MSTPQDSQRRIKPQQSIQKPGSANNQSRGKSVYFKTDSDDDDYDQDEQDGLVTRRTPRNRSAINKQFADKCMSPIQIIESPRKSANSSQQDSSSHFDETDSREKQTSDDIDTNNREDCTNILGNDVRDNDSVFDDEGAGNNDIDEDDNADLEDGEIFYDRMRRESEKNAEQNDDSFEIGEDDVDGGFEQPIAEDDAESQHTSFIEFGPTEEESEIQDMYSKLLGATNTLLGPETDLGQIGITYKMLHELIDKLIEEKKNAEESIKMLKKCTSLFPDKDKKFPLNKNIEKLMEEKIEINNRLFEEIRKTNEMAHDMYIHSQEMKNLEKLKARMSDLEKENSLLQMKRLNLEREGADKDRKINDLEKNLKLFEERRQSNAEKKPLPTRRNTQRRIAPAIQSTRKPTLGPASSQMTNLRGSYTNGQASPRPGASSAWARHYPKHS